MTPLIKHQSIKAFCIDFNWDYLGRPASPGLYARADPEEHVRWYKNLGANTIQTFCVAYNGYAWYPSEVAPVTPGLNGNFLGEITDLGHAEGMSVFGYFCLGSNPHWERLNPGLVHTEIHQSACKIPFTLPYLEYFCACVRDALLKTNINGFMIDWFRPPIGWNNPHQRDRWLDCEREMFRQLMNKPFPERGAPDEGACVEFDRRAMERAWVRIRETVDATRPVKIWTNHPFEKADDPLWSGHRLLKEVDWLLNEAPEIKLLSWLDREIGPQTKIIQNLCGWTTHDASSWKKIDPARLGFYGFAQADPATTLPSVSGADSSAANSKNIEILREAYHSI